VAAPELAESLAGEFAPNDRTPRYLIIKASLQLMRDKLRVSPSLSGLVGIRHV